MNCPVCNEPVWRGTEICPCCGSRVSPPKYTHPKPAKRHRLRALFITALLAGTFLAGLILVLMPSMPALPHSSPASTPTEVAGNAVIVYGDYFKLENGMLTFLPENYDGGSVLYVPDAINGETVTAIGTSCFRNCTELTTIYLPDSVTIIYPDAFAGCASLRGLDLPEGLLTIGAGAFDGCTALESIHVPSDMNAIASGVFDDCIHLRYIFFDGTYEAWDALYSDYISPFTYAICTDGDYYHGTIY